MLKDDGQEYGSPNWTHDQLLKKGEKLRLKREFTSLTQSGRIFLVSVGAEIYGTADLIDRWPLRLIPATRD